MSPTIETAKRWHDEPMSELTTWLAAACRRAPIGGVITCQAPDPDLFPGAYTGERLDHGGRTLRHRSLRAWLDLAESHNCRLLTPRPLDDGNPDDRDFVQFRFQVLNPLASWHRNAPSGTEKYGADSHFARIDKFEEPEFLQAYGRALDHCLPKRGGRVLNLGINRGDEWQPLLERESPDQASRWTLVGVDHSATAIAACRQRFGDSRFQFHCHDINDLAALDLGRFDLIVSIGTLHSPSISGHRILERLVKEHLHPKGALIVGFPNCRYHDGECKLGTVPKGASEPEMSPLLKEVFFYRRYLQQHRFQVHISGKYYWLLYARRG